MDFLTSIDPEQIQGWLNTYPQWAPLIAIGFAIFVSLTPLPMETIAIVNGMFFGPVLGSFYTLLGALIAAMIAFTIAKTIGYPFVRRILPDKAFHTMERIVDKEGAPTLVMIRMVPLIPFTVINYGAGVTSLHWFTFLWTSAIGMIPPTVMFVTMGDIMMENPKLALGGLLSMAVFSFFLVRTVRNRRLAVSPAEASD